LLGLNPGGSTERKVDRTIRRSLDELPNKVTNNYLDQSWGGRNTASNPLQRRVSWLLERLGFDPSEVAASNLIFVRSRAAKGLAFTRLAEICWPVHERILAIVKPTLVLVFGNSTSSPFSFLCTKFGVERASTFPSGHGAWACRDFVVPNRFRVVGLPHLSRYNIIGHPEVVEWIKATP